MKKLAPLAIAAFLFSCTGLREIQMNMTNVQLVRIDTLQRYPYASQQVLTWRSEDRIDYITYEPINKYYPLGAKMAVLVKR